MTFWEQGLRFPFCDTTLRKRAHSNGRKGHLSHQAAARRPSSFMSPLTRLLPNLAHCLGLKGVSEGCDKGGVSSSVAQSRDPHKLLWPFPQPSLPWLVGICFSLKVLFPASHAGSIFSFLRYILTSFLDPCTLTTCGPLFG